MKYRLPKLTSICHVYLGPNGFTEKVKCVVSVHVSHFRERFSVASGERLSEGNVLMSVLSIKF